MPYRLIQAGDVGINLAALVSWEWNATQQFLVLHMHGDTLYLRGEQAHALRRLLATHATTPASPPPPAD